MPQQTIGANGVKPGLTIQGWGQISQLLSNLGAVGVLVWLVLVQMPAAQQSFHNEINQEREVFREELKAERESDEANTREISGAIRELAAKVGE